MWCIPKVTPEFIERMEDVLGLYAPPYNPCEPVLCFDEKSKELHGEKRAQQRTKAGTPRRRDYEYKRNGTRNIFMAVEPKGGFRRATVTKRRTKLDFAEAIQHIALLPRYRGAALLHVVLDNLNTHDEHSLIERFGNVAARRLMRRLKFHHTPTHASWLNMAEIELSVMEGQCTKGRIGTASLLEKKLHVWQEDRNAHHAMINWTFTRAQARKQFRYRTELN